MVTLAVFWAIKITRITAPTKAAISAQTSPVPL